MDPSNLLDHDENWPFLLTFLPAGWEESARQLGALRRCRKFADAESLLRTLLIHLADGCSLRETVVRARAGNIASVSDVALLKRLRASGEWLRWLAVGLMKGWVERQPSVVFGEELCIRILDGSSIQEPGATGSTWRIHYSIGLPSLQCDEVHVTSPAVGESFKNFSVHPGDIFLADRGYAHRAGIAHVLDGGGDVIVRTNLISIPFTHADGTRFALLEKLRSLRGTRMGDWVVFVRHNDELLPGRVCALKKNKFAAQRARTKVLRESSKKGRQPRPETLEAAGYTFVFTTLPRTTKPTTVLELYRGRWQVELAFKRLKSLLSLGHLKKLDPQSAQAWIHGKLMVAFLIEALIAAGERFSPWGYPLPENGEAGSVSVARNGLHAPSG
ncbi:MAG: IS4 family transposase [Planctomycetota bacterium]|jgi:hypothetical protein